MSSHHSEKPNQLATDGSVVVNSTGKNSPVTVTVVNGRELNSLLLPVLTGFIKDFRPMFKKEPRAVPADIEIKITYNQVKVFREELNDAMNYMVVIESLIESLESEESGSEEIFLWAIHQRYLEIRRKVFIENKIDSTNRVEVMACVCKNADLIIQEVKDRIKSDIPEMKGYSVELLDFGILQVVCYGFISCNILERPPK